MVVLCIVAAGLVVRTTFEFELTVELLLVCCVLVLVVETFVRLAGVSVLVADVLVREGCVLVRVADTLVRVASVFVLVAETLLRVPLAVACEPIVRILSFGSKTVDPLTLPEL